MRMEAYDRAARGFDALSARYEELVEANPLHAILRRLSLAWLDEAFPPGIHVLEIGCGTGTEALHLARRGVRVLASDLSDEMVRATEARARAEGVSDRVRAIRCAAGQLSDVLSDQRYDGAFASFGALNCEPDLARVLEGLSELLVPNASFLVSVVSKPCLVELLGAGARLDFPKAFRRLRDETEIDLYGAERLWVRPRSKADLLRALAPGFNIERVEGWLVAIPPPYAVGAWRRLQPVQAPLLWLDERLRRTWPFLAWGDHLHVWARRRAG